MVLAIHLYRRMMKRGRVLALLALSAVPGLVYWLTAFDARPGEAEALYSDIVTTAGFTYPIAALILTVATLREERDSGTLPYLYMRPISRTSLAVSALAAGTAAALVIAVGGWLATVVASLAVGTGLSTSLPGLALFVSAAVGYAAIFVPLGYLMSRAVLAGLGYVIVVESILGAAVAGLAQFSIWRIAASIYADLAPVVGSDAEDLLNGVTPGVGGGVIKIAAVVVVGLGVLIWALRKRDAL